ncbi:MAG: hypothetical protein ACKOAU_20060 [Pirellula sp.]|jgi:hypothetical protein
MGRIPMPAFPEQNAIQQRLFEHRTIGTGNMNRPEKSVPIVNGVTK